MVRNGKADLSVQKCTMNYRRIQVFVAVLAFIIPSFVSADLLTGLVSVYDCQETSGARFDSVGSNDLTDNNTVLYGVGMNGNACDFENTTSESLSITDANQSGLDFSTTLSFSMWVKFEAIDGLSDYFFVRKQGTAGGTRGYDFFYTSSTDLLFFRGSIDGTAVVNVSTAWNPSADTWYLVGVTYNAATVKFYIDGSQTGVDKTLTGVTSLYNNSEVFYIGNNTAGDSGMDGLLDEIYLYNVTLSSDQISELYAAGEGFFYPFTVEEIYGCTDPEAENYDPEATIDDGSCTYPPVTPPLYIAGFSYGELMIIMLLLMIFTLMFYSELKSWIFGYRIENPMRNKYNKD